MTLTGTTRSAIGLDALRERLAAIEHRAPSSVAVPTGWKDLDAVFTGSGLQRNAVHEWIGLDPLAPPKTPNRRWSPPLGVLLHLARQSVIATHGHFTTISALWRHTNTKTASLRHLAAADAFGSMNLSRQAALWAIQPLHDESLPLFDSIIEPAIEPAYLPRSTPFRQVTQDYAAAGLSLRPHPISFVREELHAQNVTPNGLLSDEKAAPDKRRVTVAGLVLVRQRPRTASGVIFMTIEDESGIANLVVWPQIFERFRAVVRHSTAIICSGQIQRVGEVVHVVARQFKRLDLHALNGVRSRDFH